MKRLIVFCGWAGDGGQQIPSFFKEQAELFKPEFNISFVSFQETYLYGIRAFLKDPYLCRVKEFSTEAGDPIFRFEYVHFRILPSFINRFIVEKVYKHLNTKLHLTNRDNTIIHVQGLYKAGFFAKEIKERWKVPFVLTEHDQFTLIGVPKNDLETIQQVLNSSNQVFAISTDKVRQILTLRFSFDYKLIGNMIDEKIFYPPLTKSHQAFTIITVAAYNWIKDQQTIFHMLKRLDELLASEDEVRFHFVGFNGWGGDHQEEIEQIFEDLRLKKIKVKLTPLATRHQVAEFLRDADLFVLSSISEGMPVSVLEALASGLPVCSTRCGGVDDVINDSNGKVVPIKNVDAMLDFVYKCCKGMMPFDKLHISNEAVRNFGQNVFKQKLLSEYNRVLNSCD